jgi:hypothetical protein
MLTAVNSRELGGMTSLRKGFLFVVTELIFQATGVKINRLELEI